MVSLKKVTQQGESSTMSGTDVHAAHEVMCIKEQAV